MGCRLWGAGFFMAGMGSCAQHMAPEVVAQKIVAVCGHGRNRRLACRLPFTKTVKAGVVGPSSTVAVGDVEGSGGLAVVVRLVMRLATAACCKAIGVPDPCFRAEPG